VEKIRAVKLFALSLVHGDHVFFTLENLNFISNLGSASNKISFPRDGQDCSRIFHSYCIVIISVAKYDVRDPKRVDLTKSTQWIKIILIHLAQGCIMGEEQIQTKIVCLLHTKKNILKSNSFDVMQTVFFAFTCKFGLVL